MNYHNSIEILEALISQMKMHERVLRVMVLAFAGFGLMILVNELAGKIWNWFSKKDPRTGSIIQG